MTKFSLQRLDGMSEIDNHLVSFPHCGTAVKRVRVAICIQIQRECCTNTRISITHLCKALEIIWISAVEPMGWVLLADSLCPQGQSCVWVGDCWFVASISGSFPFCHAASSWFFFCGHQIEPSISFGPPPTFVELLVLLECLLSQPKSPPYTPDIPQPSNQ